MDFIKNKLSYKVTKMQDFIPFLTVKQDTIPIEVRPYSEDVIPVFKKTLFLASVFFSGLLQYILCENQDVETRLRTIFSGLSIQNRNNYSFLLFSCCFFVA